jgi:pimeloyl-ACP methyl ester carboxylesterase
MHWLALLLIGCMGLTGCLPPELAKQIPFDIPGITPAKEAAEDAAEEEEEEEEAPAAPVKPKHAAPKMVALKPDQILSSLLDDGLKLSTHVFKPVKAGNTVIWLIPPLGNRYQDWEALIKSALAKGITVLVTDLRGQGQSSRFDNGQSVSWRLFTPEDWPKLHQDLLKQLTVWGKTPPLQARNWVLVSGSTGSVVAGQLLAHWPAERPKLWVPQLMGVAFWSPRLKVKKLDATDGLLKLNAPLLLLGNPNDTLSADAWRVMPKLANGDIQTRDVTQGKPADTGSLLLSAGLPHFWQWVETLN